MRFFSPNCLIILAIFLCFACSAPSSDVRSANEETDQTAVSQDDSDTDPQMEAGLRLMREIHFGELRLGLSPEEVIDAIGEASQQGEITEEPATGNFIQEWSYPDQGITLWMDASTADGEQTVGLIVLRAPCSLRDQHNIGIGSTEQDVRAAYGAYEDSAESEPNRFVAGSVYAGVTFTFVEGQVTEIGVGSSAE